MTGVHFRQDRGAAKHKKSYRSPNSDSSEAGSKAHTARGVLSAQQTTLLCFSIPRPLAAGLVSYRPCSFGNKIEKTVTKTRKMENTKETKKFRAFVIDSFLFVSSQG